MDLFRKTLRSLWEDTERCRDSIPEIVKDNTEWLSSIDVEYLLGLEAMELDEPSFISLIKCLVVVGQYCPSYEKRVIRALERLSESPLENVQQQATEGIEQLARPSIPPVLSRFASR